MLGLGGPELVVLLLIVMMVFGVGKLPQVGGALGKGVREFKEGITGRLEGDTGRVEKVDSSSAGPEQVS